MTHLIRCCPGVVEELKPQAFEQVKLKTKHKIKSFPFPVKENIL
jgi:hypothetical protein